MRRFLTITCALALGASSALFVSACGGSDGGGISSASADTLLGVLDDIEQRIDDGDCDAAADIASNAAVSISDAPRDAVEPELQTALIDGFQRLASLASDPEQCSAEETTTDETTTEEDTTAEEPTVTEEAPPEETQTQTTPTPPDGGGGSGGGGSGGVGPGGVSP